MNSSTSSAPSNESQHLLHKQQPPSNTPSTPSTSSCSSTSPSTSSPPSNFTRHLSLFDLICIGVGSTVGSGIFQLCGLIAKTQAGPATIISQIIGGVVATLSGVCSAELAGKIPSAGSAYAYAAASIGPYPAFVAGSYLSAIYIGTGAAVARSWGDKLFVWVKTQMDGGDWVLWVLKPGGGVNTVAFLASTASTVLLCKGVKESKFVANLFTILKVVLVLFMIGLGLCLTKPTNLHPFIPPEFGVRGVFRGATASFFGYISFDEACMLGGEAKDARVNLPRAILGTIFIVMTMYATAAFALTGMQDYKDISEESGFPQAFYANGWEKAAQITAVGELVVLPIVVLLTLMAQPRLQWALAMDGYLPAVFAEIDEHGNLFKGTLYAGTIMILLATFLPFAFLDDFTSAAQMLVFCISNASVVKLRYPDSSNVNTLLLVVNILSMTSGLIYRHFWDNTIGHVIFGALSLILIGVVTLIARNPAKTCPSFYEAPLNPFIPCLGIYVNWYLVSQLDLSAFFLLVLFFAMISAFYCYYTTKSDLHKGQQQHFVANRTISLTEC